MVGPPQPIFPPELEHIIFDFAIQDNLHSAGRLSLVSKRVRRWMIPHIYKVAIFDYNTTAHRSYPKVSVESLLEHGKHVRHLLVQNSTFAFWDEYDIPVSRCPNLLSLALWMSCEKPFTPKLVESLTSLKLKCLSFDMNSLIDALTKQGRSTQMSFPTVTHLELVGFVESPAQVKEFFPNITHLAISSFSGTRLSVLMELLTVFGDQLEVLIWYVLEDGGSRQVLPSVVTTSRYIVVDDPRVVVLYYGVSFLGSWCEGANGGQGIWRVADEAVRARRTSQSAV